MISSVRAALAEHVPPDSLISDVHPRVIAEVYGSVYEIRCNLTKVPDSGDLSGELIAFA
jgi:hypothetical protein